ncbi:hypothetical protein K4Q40_09195 [Staphylococcus epidermidis]|nr:hypothetical protein [Staphylococcus epidermidis]MCG2494397.1 hypothetical protein [Staphylococcus epidermidis]UIK43199.1 hypothetical protein J4Z29_001600 [Staphylococcus epidermidis]
MKKIINILLIAILSIIFIGLTLFVVNFAKDMLINDNQKSETVSKNEDKKKKDTHNKSKQTDIQNDSMSSETNQNNSQQNNSNNQSLETSSQNTNNSNQSSKTNNQDISKNHTDNQKNSNEDPNNVMQYDKNDDGIISRGEVTPEAQKLVDEGKLQPTSDALAKEWSTAKKENNME